MNLTGVCEFDKTNLVYPQAKVFPEDFIFLMISR